MSTDNIFGIIEYPASLLSRRFAGIARPQIVVKTATAPTSNMLLACFAGLPVDSHLWTLGLLSTFRRMIEMVDPREQERSLAAAMASQIHPIGMVIKFGGAALWLWLFVAGFRGQLPWTYVLGGFFVLFILQLISNKLLSAYLSKKLFNEHSE